MEDPHEGTMTVEECVKEIVVRGLRDWIQAAEGWSVVKRMGGITADDEIRNLTLAIVRTVLEEELMTIGGLVKGPPGGLTGHFAEFSEWQVPIEEALARVARAWDSLGRLPGIGDLFWLSNTEKGNQRGREWQAEETS